MNSSSRRRPSCRRSWRLTVTVFLSCVATLATSYSTEFGYIPSTIVGNYLNLALDIKQMRTTTAIADKLRIYQQGNHSGISLAYLSLSAGEQWKDVPIYKIFLDAFNGLAANEYNHSAGSFNGYPVEQYADTLVLDLCTLNLPRIEGTGSLVHNVLMSYWGYLWQMLQACPTNNVTAMNEALDIAVALWIGAGQERGDTQTGYMLYNMAQFAGTQFGQDSSESTVNSNVVQTFLDIQQKIKTGVCADTEVGYETMRNQVHSLMKYSNTMLVQMLLYHIQDVLDNGTPSDFVELFALALNPQIGACDTGLYNNITEYTVSYSINATSGPQAVKVIQQGLSCLGITCADVGSYLGNVIPACLDRNGVAAPLPTLAEYMPSTDVRDTSYIDRDIRQMRSFMELGSWAAARNYYVYGWNSNFTLQQMASNELYWTASDVFDLFTSFYNTDTADSGYGFGNDLILAAMDGAVPFATVLDAARMGIVVGALDSMVMYLGIHGQLSASIAACDQNQNDKAASHWDSAVALLIGSAEGESAGGQPGGQSIFALSKTLCNAFGTCEPTSSVVDTILLASWQAGAAAIQVGECEQTREILDSKIKPFLLFPLVRGLLYYSVQAALTSDLGEAWGLLVAYTQAILPYVDPDSVAPLVSNIQTNTEIDIAGAFDVIRDSLPSMGLDCALIGQLPVNGVEMGVCTDGAFAPGPADPTAPTQSPSALGPVFVPDPSKDGLAWGRYTFVNETVATNDSMFTLGLRDMWFSATPEAAKAIYANQSKYAVNGLSGHPEVRSLQDFSTKASLFMGQDPMYNFFRVALFDDESFDGNTSGIDGGWPFADAVEELAVGPLNGNSAQLGSKAVAVMEIWMMILHKLYDAVRKCETSQNAADLIDSAVGLWIGQEQGEGKFNSGWSVYSIAQEAAEFYGLAEGEAKVNTDLMKLFVNAQNLTQSCSVNWEAAATLRALVDDIVRTLSIPLLQHLFFHMSDNNFPYVELYALAFVPQTVSVDEGAFESLRNSLFEGFNWDTSIDDIFLATISKVLYAMRITCEDLGDVSAASQNLMGLVQLVCVDFENYDPKTGPSMLLAAYETSVDVNELARIDLDVLQIDLFMRANAYDLALSVYQNGRNSREVNGVFYTLQGLATSKDNAAAGDVQQLYEQFYGTDVYADKIITEALTSRNTDRYAGLSRRQVSESVRRTLQTMVTYIQMIARLRAAIVTCRANTETVAYDDDGPIAGQSKVDEAVALYVGSIEGPFSGGNDYRTGQMMYALAKEMCPFFDNCETHGDSDTNVFLLFAFSNMKESLDQNDCDSAESVLVDSILTVLPVPLVQGILYFADQNEGESSQATNSSLTAGEILTETLLPQIDNINATIALLVSDNMIFDFDVPAVRDGAKVVFDALASVVRGMGIDCNTVGTLVTNGLSVCSPEVAPAPDTPTNLGDNLYVTTTYVQDTANIALDIKEMEQDLLLGRVQAAKSVYEDGRNSQIYNAQGKEIDVRALAAFSTNATDTMKSNPVYQIAVYALRDETGKYLGKDASQYADSVVQEMFEKGVPSKEPLAAEAAVALNLWMELANLLFQTVTNCKNNTLTDKDGIHSIDEAVAYWIGDGQIAGDAERGHLLYALAEKMGDQFSINNSGQSRTNINILRLFHQAKMGVSLSNACADNPDTSRRVRHIVDNIISLMVVVNVQALIHNLLQDDESDRVRIYAHAFVPLVAGCSPQTFKYLKEKLLDAPYREVDVENITAAIRSTFPCFGIMCDDVGVHSLEPKTACTDPSPLSSLADYKPANDVSEYAKLDLDILELDILMQMQAYDAAEELYYYGKHTSMGASGDGTAISLESLATTPGRTVVPQYDAFVRYFKNDGKYADTMIRGALVPTSGGTSEIKRSTVVTGTAQYMVMYMAALLAMHEAIGTCNSSGSERGSSAAKSWDKVAALITGSLEGTSEGGSTGGRLLWALSKKYCGEFGTCSKENILSSKTNDKIATLLFSGRGAVLGGSCDELRKATNELGPLLLVPLLQASLSSTSTLAQRSPKDKDLVQAEAYVYAQALLPLIEYVDKSAATTISQNFPLEGQAVRDGVHVVANAYASVISGLGVNCEDVGSNIEIDACTGQVNSSKTGKLLMAFGIIFGTVALVGIFILVRSKRKIVKPEDAPIFVVPKGELNHTSELLCSRTDASANPRNSDGEADLLNNDASDPMEDDNDNDNDEYVRAIESALNSERVQVV